MSGLERSDARDELSGGNQQKVLFGKWLFRPPARADRRRADAGGGHRREARDLRPAPVAGAAGMAILLISSELEEVLGLAHRVMVMRKGRIVAELAGDALTEDALLAAAFAVDETEAVA